MIQIRLFERREKKERETEWKNNGFLENCNQNVTMFVDTIIVNRLFDVDKWSHRQSISWSRTKYKYT